MPCNSPPSIFISHFFFGPVMDIKCIPTFKFHSCRFPRCWELARSLFGICRILILLKCSSSSRLCNFDLIFLYESFPQNARVHATCIWNLSILQPVVNPAVCSTLFSYCLLILQTMLLFSRLSSERARRRRKTKRRRDFSWTHTGFNDFGPECEGKPGSSTFWTSVAPPCMISYSCSKSVHG